MRLLALKTHEDNHTGVEMFRKLLDQGEAGDVGFFCVELSAVEQVRSCKTASITPHAKFKCEAHLKDEGGRHTPFSRYAPVLFSNTD